MHTARSEERVSSSPEMEASPKERMTIMKVELPLFDGTDPVGCRDLFRGSGVEGGNEGAIG